MNFDFLIALSFKAAEVSIFNLSTVQGSLRDQLSTVFNVGRYLDVIVPTPDGLKFAERQCIYDSEMIPNSLIYPI